MDCLPRVWEGWSGLWAGVLSVYRCNPQPRIEIAARGFKIRAPNTIFFFFLFIIKKTFQNSSRAINRHPAGHKRPAGRYLSMTALDCLVPIFVQKKSQYLNDSIISTQCYIGTITRSSKNNYFPVVVSQTQAFLFGG